MPVDGAMICVDGVVFSERLILRLVPRVVASCLDEPSLLRSNVHLFDDESLCRFDSPDECYRSGFFDSAFAWLPPLDLIQ